MHQSRVVPEFVILPWQLPRHVLWYAKPKKCMAILGPIHIH